MRPARSLQLVPAARPGNVAAYTAIVGAAGRYPSQSSDFGDLHSFWSSLAEGSDLPRLMPLQASNSCQETFGMPGVVAVWEPSCQAQTHKFANSRRPHIWHSAGTWSDTTCQIPPKTTPCAPVALCHAWILHCPACHAAAWLKVLLAPPPTRRYVRLGGFMDNVDAFDPGLFRLAAAEALALDPQTRVLLEQVGCEL